jgi:hypothetical protein
VSKGKVAGGERDCLLLFGCSTQYNLSTWCVTTCLLLSLYTVCLSIGAGLRLPPISGIQHLATIRKLTQAVPTYTSSRCIAAEQNSNNNIVEDITPLLITILENDSGNLGE